MFSKFKAFEGPGRYTWKDPDTEREFQANDKKELIDRITAYRKQNNLEEIEHLGFILESYWCSLPENQHKCVPVSLERGLLGYLKGGVALVKTMLYNSFAPQTVADVRSEQCAECKFNVFPDKGMFVKWSDDIALASIGDRRSRRHNDLGQCSVCSCPLRAKVFYYGTVDIEPDWVEPFESVACWQLRLDPKLKRT